MKQKNLVIIIAIALITLIISCSKDDFQDSVGLCPAVVATSPANLVTNVALNDVITVTFNKEINPATINSSSFKINGTIPLAGTISYSGVTATFVPTNALPVNTTFVGTVSTAVQDLSGNALQQDYIWTFSTGSTIRPKVATTSPTPNETNVALNKIVEATFNMPMNPATITTSSFTLKQGTTVVPGTVTYNANTAFFKPTSALTVNTVYTATITTAAQNLAGVSIATDYIWNFTTGTNIAPIVSSTSPNPEETGVLLNKVITATFNMAMDPLTLTTTTFSIRQGNAPIAGNVTYAGTTASFTPTNPLLANTRYTATITTAVKSSTGISLANNYVWSFTTQSTSSSGPNLGSAAIFGAFGGNAGVTNQGLNTIINGSIGTTAASTLVTGFHDASAIYTETTSNVGFVTNGIFTAPPMPGTSASFAIASQGLADANAAYNAMSPANLPGGTDPGAGELGGLTLAPGIYKSASGTFKITNGDLTLDAQGNPNATWVFQTAAGLTVGIAGPTGAKSVIMIGGAPKNVFWYVGSAATINAAGGGTMVGTIIANSGVTFSTAGNAAQTVLNGRAISLVSSVTMVNTTINVPN